MEGKKYGGKGEADPPFIALYLSRRPTFRKDPTHMPGLKLRNLLILVQSQTKSYKYTDH